VRTVVADIGEEAAVANALDDRHFDAVVDWIAFTPDQIERDIRLFRGGRISSSLSALRARISGRRPHLITESTPLVNPYWQYSRDKIACEDRLICAYRDEGFPITIVRPSLTYGDTQIVLAVNSWQKSFTAIDACAGARR